MIKTGISTASLYDREYNEIALDIFNKLDVKNAEVFLTSFCEYKKEFAEILLAHKGNVDINSIHVLNTEFEPQLYANQLRVRTDASIF
jgi:hypothetical protein